MDPDIRSAYFSREIPKMTDQNLFFWPFLKAYTLFSEKFIHFQV